MAPELALGNTDFENLAISPLRELGVYEACGITPVSRSRRSPRISRRVEVLCRPTL